MGVELLCTRTNVEISKIDECLQTTFNTDLKSQISSFFQCESSEDDYDDYDGLRLFLNNIVSLQRYESFDVSYDTLDSDTSKIMFLFSNINDILLNASNYNMRHAIENSDFSEINISKSQIKLIKMQYRRYLINLLSKYNYSQISLINENIDNFYRNVTKNNEWESNKFTRLACGISIDMSDTKLRHYYFGKKLHKLLLIGDRYHKNNADFHTMLHFIILSRCETDLLEVLQMFIKINETNWKKTHKAPQLDTNTNISEMKADSNSQLTNNTNNNNNHNNYNDNYNNNNESKGEDKNDSKNSDDRETATNSNDKARKSQTKDMEDMEMSANYESKSTVVNVNNEKYNESSGSIWSDDNNNNIDDDDMEEESQLITFKQWIENFSEDSIARTEKFVLLSLCGYIKFEQYDYLNEMEQLIVNQLKNKKLDKNKSKDKDKNKK